MKIDHNNISVIILAGGSSSRMGNPKSWVKMGNGSTFLSAIVSSFIKFGISEVIVVLNEKFTSSLWEKELSIIKQHATIIENPKPEKGRLYSLSLGLKATTISELVFIHNVDSPFVEKATLEQLINNVEVNGVTIPSFSEKGGHPVIINTDVKNEVVSNYQQYKTLKDVFTNFPKKYVEVDNDSILKNINSPQELEELKNELA